jgi:hypothetical protein
VKRRILWRHCRMFGSHFWRSGTGVAYSIRPPLTRHLAFRCDCPPRWIIQYALRIVIPSLLLLLLLLLLTMISILLYNGNSTSKAFVCRSVELYQVVQTCITLLLLFLNVFVNAPIMSTHDSNNNNNNNNSHIYTTRHDSQRHSTCHLRCHWLLSDLLLRIGIGDGFDGPPKFLKK